MGRNNKKTEINTDKWITNARDIVLANVPCEVELAVAKISRVIPWHVSAKRQTSAEAIARSSVTRMVRRKFIVLEGTMIVSAAPRATPQRRLRPVWISLMSSIRAGGVIKCSAFEGLAEASVRTYLYNARKLQWVTLEPLPEASFQVVWHGPDDASPSMLIRKRKL